MSTTTYAAVMAALGVMGIFVLLGLLVWAIVTMTGRPRALVAGGLGALLLADVVNMLGSVVVSAGRESGFTGLLAVGVLRFLISTAGIAMVVLGAIWAGRGSRTPVPPAWGQGQAPYARQDPR